MRLIILCAVLAAACGGGDEETGASCEVADDCYDIEARDQIVGTIECLDRVPDGYCTHTCVDDNDCCTIEGECTEENPQVCAPFENDPTTRCFLSCEADIIGDMEENDYCHEFASEDFICRSTGAGAENRKVCVPEG